MTISKTDLVDYRKFRLSKLNTPEFAHLKYMIYWPIYGLLFLTVERLWIRDYYFPMYCPLNDAIPFCEYFLLPYLLWFLALPGMLIYGALLDTDSFKKMMQFIMITYTAAITIYILFPNCQELRPTAFPRDNLLTRFIADFYQFDTNTNVCPSVHVIGAVAVMLCGWHSKHFHSMGWRIAFGACALLISVSTVFLKQHSILDVLAAIPICLIGYFVVYKRKKSNQ